MTDKIVAERDAVIAAALHHVPFDGWSWKALEAGAVDAGMKAVDARRLFIDGLAGATDHFADRADRQMLAALEAMDLNSMRIRDRIHACVKTRIQQNAAHKEALRRLLSFLALPTNAGLASRITWRSCSVMWYAAGDRSADWNHYSKRGLLAAVYSSTVLYWLSDDGDDSGDFPDTWAFLDRRIDDVLKTFSLPKRIKGRVESIAQPIMKRFQRFAPGRAATNGEPNGGA